jgi:hypothetical protein
VRLSCDIRWQPADQPIDQRYIGTFDDVKAGIEGVNKAEEEEAEAQAQAEAKAKSVTIQELRSQWGFPVRPGHDFK